MSNKVEDLALVLCKGSNSNRITVSLESFLLFNAEIDRELDYLVDRWSDFMTPKSLADRSHR